MHKTVVQHLPTSALRIGSGTGLARNATELGMPANILPFEKENSSLLTIFLILVETVQELLALNTPESAQPPRHRIDVQIEMPPSRQPARRVGLN